MAQVSEITKRESAPQETSRRSKVKEWISLIKIVFSSDWRKFRAMNPEERYVRPQKEYEIPPFHENMKYCTSNEPYLRPTRWCNPAGIKARYKTYTLKLSQEILDSATDERGRLVHMLFDFGGTSEGEGEAYIDGNWVVAHVAMRPELYANAGLPITKFGEDSINFTFRALPGTIRRFEFIPLSLGLGSKVGMRFISLPMEQANIHIQKRYVSGRKIIEEAGGVEAYDQNARMKYGPSTSMTGLKDDDALVFEE